MDDAICDIAMETIQKNGIWNQEAAVAVAVDSAMRHVVAWLYNEGEDELAELLTAHREL